MIRDLILRWARNRQPDFVIGGEEKPYLRRHWLIPRNRVFNVYVHEFQRSDDDRALHTHPYLFNASWLLEGQYREHIPGKLGGVARLLRRPGEWTFRWGASPHRIQLAPAIIRRSEVISEHPCWTVFITGPRVREWGFLCPRGFVHWRDFTDARDSGAIGRGCDQ